MKLHAGCIDVISSVSPILTSFPSPMTHTTATNKKLLPSHSYCSKNLVTTLVYRFSVNKDLCVTNYSK
jgi:hypothetical protein